jgi:hypothetical protein
MRTMLPMLLVAAAVAAIWVAADGHEQDQSTGPLTAAAASSTPSLSSTHRIPVNLAVSYKAGALTIDVQNAPLSDVLQEICRQIGAKLDFPADANERVTAALGPAPVKVVLGSLLGNTRFDYATSGRVDDPTALAGLVVFPKSTPNAQRPAVAAQSPAQPGEAAKSEEASSERPVKYLHDLLAQAKAGGSVSVDAADGSGVDPEALKKVEDILKEVDTKVADAAAQPPSNQASPVPSGATPPRRRHRH